jgi:hypothetical protein
MKKVISLFFNTDRTYITKVNNSKAGLELEYLNSTENPIDLDSIHSSSTIEGFDEIETILKNMDIQCDMLNLVFPAEAIMTSQLPGKVKMKKDEILNLISLELKRAYPKLNINDFEIQVVQMGTNKKGESNLLAVIYQKNDLNLFEQLFQKYNLPIQMKYVSQIASANAFLYNYPEFQQKNAAIIGIQNNFVDFCVISNNQMIYYNLLNYSNESDIPEILEKELNKVTADIVDDLSAGLFFYGADLTKNILLSVWEIAMLFGVEGKRLNSFRMIKTNLSRREREYASRTMQIYPACIGGTLPNFFPSVTI